VFSSINASNLRVTKGNPVVVEIITALTPISAEFEDDTIHKNNVGLVKIMLV
jgi:hypothetical protein